MNYNSTLVKSTIIVCCLLFPINLFAQQNYSISGVIILKELKGDIFITVVDEETNNMPMGGIKKQVLIPTSKKLTFSFSNLPEGVYALKCFQDENGNEKLDRGMFGPKEPWFLSWNGSKRYPPRWEDINFRLDKNKVFEIVLE